MPTENVTAPSEPEDWFVFETFGADGTLAIGMARGTPDPSAGIVVRDGLTRKAANEVASRLATEHRAKGMLLESVGDRGLPTDPGDV